MDIYKKRGYWKLLLMIIGLSIVVFSVIYIRGLAKEIAKQEEEKAGVIAEAYRDLDVTTDPDSLNNILEIISENKLIPLIYTYSDGEDAVYYSNWDTSKVNKPKYLIRQTKKLKKRNQVIELDFDKGEKHFMYYGDSALLRKVKLYPYFQLGLIGLFMLISYIAFSASRRAEQNRVWVGMAKETAHQLGTPLSSIAAWVDILKTQVQSQENFSILNDMDKDIQRLELVADRFSKIGSPPKLTKQPLLPLVDKVVDYISKRASSKVKVSMDNQTQNGLNVMMNTSLMDWVFENLMKNALDAIENEGELHVVVNESTDLAIIEISDTGKGIPKSKFNTIFEPGFSTKKRGWGIGLTLVKRIVEQYHSGKIFVKHSIPGKGTTFRIELKKHD